jgi:CRP-like cAMP-binding protein
MADFPRNEKAIGKIDEETDSTDFSFFFNANPHPACILEPIFGQTGKLDNLRFKYRNEAFRRIYEGPNDKADLAGLLRLEGLDASGLFALVEGIKIGGKRCLGVTIPSRSTRYSCDILRTPSGNFAAFVKFLPDTINDTQKRIQNEIILKTDGDDTSVRLVVDIETGIILDTNKKAELFYGKNAQELRGIMANALIENYDQQYGICGRENPCADAIVARHHTDGDTIIEARTWSFIAKWNEKAAIYTVIDDRDSTSIDDSPISTGLHDKLGRPVCRSRFSAFLAKHRDIPFLPELIERIIPHGVLANYEKGDHFLEYGETTREIGFILEGVFRQYTMASDGKEYTLGFYRSGNILDSYSSIKFNRPSVIAFEAITDCKLYVVDLRVLTQIALADTRWYRLFYYNLSNRLVGQHERDYSLLCEDATTRYRRFLSTDGDIAQFLKSYNIASYLGISAETLSRIRKTLSDTNE